jgi:uncharacterized protein YoxC
MPAPAYATLFIVAVVVLALVYYLVQVIRVLTHVNDTLGKVTFGVRSIAHQTEPIGEIVGTINTDLGAVAGALEALVASVTATSPVRQSA